MIFENLEDGNKVAIRPGKKVLLLHGSDINIAALSDVKSLADLKKLGIFNHLPNEDEANKDLFEVLKPAKKQAPPQPIEELE